MPLNILTVDLRYEADVVVARQRARQIAAGLKFDPQAQTRIATAVSEIARNAYKYAGGGKVEFQLDDSDEQALLIKVQDRGPGIPNLETILNGRYVSPTGMGLGIIGAKRLMDRFEIETAERKGTTVSLGKILPGQAGHVGRANLRQLVADMAKRSPQDPYEELQQQNRELLRTLEELRVRQAELAQLNQELDDTNRGVVALYAELNDRADYLQRASELKSLFLSNMSHEFRTPLNSILALSRILIDRIDGELTPEQQKQVNFIRGSAQDLLDLVNDLLDLSRVEAGKIAIRPSEFEVDSLFGALRGMLKPLLAENSSVSLVFEEPPELPPMYSDEGKISQILRNFLSNALKFTERGEIRVSVTTGEGGMVVFSVADTGIGIAPENQELIFKEWTQIEGPLQKKAKGSGLGLPLSRKLAQLLGGDVYVKSTPGLGSTFFLSVPSRFEAAVEAVFVPEIGRELDPTRLPVLIVEDNPEAQFIYEKYLKGTGFQGVPATDLKQARQAMREFRPTAIILDVLLQGENSWEFLRELKQDPQTKEIPVLVVTVVDNRHKALSMHASAFCEKPVDRGWLLKNLQIAANAAREKVLIIDDDEVSRYLLKGLLSSTRYSAVEAKDGSEGLRLAKESKPRMIFLDIGMPQPDGFEVLDRLKADSETKQIPVVIHTAKSLSASELSRLTAASDFFPKEDVSSRERASSRLKEVFAKTGLVPVGTERPIEVHTSK